MTEREIFEGIHNECGNLEICTYNKTGCGDCLIRQTLIKAEKALKENRPHEHNYETCHNLTCRTKCKKDGWNNAVEEVISKAILIVYEAHCKLLELEDEMMKGKKDE